jgi:hypothetical protein
VDPVKLLVDGRTEKARINPGPTMMCLHLGFHIEKGYGEYSVSVMSTLLSSYAQPDPNLIRTFISLDCYIGVIYQGVERLVLCRSFEFGEDLINYPDELEHSFDRWYPEGQRDDPQWRTTYSLAKRRGTDAVIWQRRRRRDFGQPLRSGRAPPRPAADGLSLGVSFDEDGRATVNDDLLRDACLEINKSTSLEALKRRIRRAIRGRLTRSL